MITAAVPTAKKPITPDIQAPLARQIIGRQGINININNKNNKNQVLHETNPFPMQHKALILRH